MAESVQRAKLQKQLLIFEIIKILGFMLAEKAHFSMEGNDIDYKYAFVNIYRKRAMKAVIFVAVLLVAL
ncbi:hypothetical protein M513_14141, partial [Trichuris suis]